MTTWREEFARLSAIERKAIEEWTRNKNATNRVIDAKETTNAFLIAYERAGRPDHDDEMPS